MGIFRADFRSFARPFFDSYWKSILGHSEKILGADFGRLGVDIGGISYKGYWEQIFKSSEPILTNSYYGEGELTSEIILGY